MPNWKPSKRSLGLLTRVAPEYYTLAGLRAVLLMCDLDDENGSAPIVSKQKVVVDAVQRGLAQRNAEGLAILAGEVAGRVLEQPESRRGQTDELLIQSLAEDGWTQHSTASSSVRFKASSDMGAIEVSPSELLERDNGIPDVSSRSVFIVHGRDASRPDAVARLLEKQGFLAVILHEREDRGRTILEKFEAEAADAAYAVVLLTPDDRGGLSEDEALAPRARQNVVFEFGYFNALLGRTRVAALTYGEVEIPSDLHGLLYIRVQEGSDDWKMKLLREMRAAGLPIDLNRA